MLVQAAGEILPVLPGPGVITPLAGTDRRVPKNVLEKRRGSEKISFLVLPPLLIRPQFDFYLSLS